MGAGPHRRPGTVTAALQTRARSGRQGRCVVVDENPKDIDVKLVVLFEMRQAGEQFVRSYADSFTA